MTYRRNLYKCTVALFLMGLTLGSCSDWDDHYSATPQSGESLWTTLSQNSELSHFTKVLQACGYDAALKSSQVFTVFAPNNSHFSAEQADSVIALYQAEKARGVKNDDNMAIKEFVQNHIALYNYSTATAGSDSVTMINGKYQVLTPKTFGGEQMTSVNQQCSNGVLFTLAHTVPYIPNVYEHLSKDADLDSVGHFYKSYSKYIFDPSQSVPGGIVNGRTQYLDSVFHLKNELFSEVGPINREDSTYWVLAPTNRQWQQLTNEYEKYFNYANNVKKRDSLQFIHSRLSIIRGTVFSRTRNTDATINDSVLSTNAYPYKLRRYVWGRPDLAYYQFQQPFANGGVFASTSKKNCSNGMVLKPTTWNVNKLNTFWQEIIVEGEASHSLKKLSSLKTKDPLTVVTVQSRNPFYNKVSNNSYVEIIPKTSSVNDSAAFNVHNVLSNIGYDIYVVTVPALAGDTLATAEQRLPYKFNCTLGYIDQNGEEKTMTLKRGAVTKADVIDSVLVGKNVRIPTCSYGLDIPQVSITLESYVKNRETSKYSRTIRLDCIVLKPHRE